MNNKEYKAIVKKAAKRFERLQELELKDSNRIENRVNWFIAEYISKNQLKEFFQWKLLNNAETQIYLLRHNKKIPIMRVGNKVIKTNLIKRLDNLINFLNEDEKEKYNFIKTLKDLKHKFVYDEETGINKLIFDEYCGDYLAIFNPTFKYNMVNFRACELKIVHKKKNDENNFGNWIAKGYSVEQIEFNKSVYFTIEDLEKLIKEMRNI